MTSRQFAWHKANGNKVWPGTFNLAEYIDQHIEYYRSGPILELGAATGALSMYLSSDPHNFDICTSDIEDNGEVQENIAHNFALNGLSVPHHVTHTWGSGWPSHRKNYRNKSEAAIKGVDHTSSHGSIEVGFKFVIASDILLYVR